MFYYIITLITMKVLSLHIIGYLLVLCTLSSGALLYPYGALVGDKSTTGVDDACRDQYSQQITLFGRNYSTLYVCTNGVISMDITYTGYTPETFPLPPSSSNTALICPFWADANPRYGGYVWSRETNDASLLNRASLEVRNTYTSDPTYSAKWMLIATWDQLRAYGTSPSSVANTFQAVLVSDGVTAFAIFNYKEINWHTGTSSQNTAAQVGFDSGDGVNYYATPNSQKPAIKGIATDSNVGVPGKMIFKLGTSGSNTTKIALPNVNITTTNILSTSYAPTTSNTTTTITTTTQVPTTTRVLQRPEVRALLFQPEEKIDDSSNAIIAASLSTIFVLLLALLTVYLIYRHRLKKNMIQHV